MSEQLETFLNRDSDLPKLIVIYGPTASGKTARSIELAQMLDTEVISSDSRQIYRMMDIGTAKVTEEEMQGIRHHLIDVIDPHERFSVGDWLTQTQLIIDRLGQKDKIPIICGGTGLYIDALIYGFSLPDVGEDLSLREKLEAFRKKHGNEALWEKLQVIDPDYAEQLHPNNYRYVMRGIEIKELTGKSKLDFGRGDPKYDVYLECPGVKDRDELYARIDLRVDLMMQGGLLLEIQKILDHYELSVEQNGVQDVLERLPGFDSIGYKEVLHHFSGMFDLGTCILEIQKNTRHYAKRQLTWFRKYNDSLELFSKK